MAEFSVNIQVSGIAPAQLHQLLTSQGHSVLLIDCQDQHGSAGGAQTMRINHSNCIAIPASGLVQLHDGKKADKSVGKYLKKSGRDYDSKIWKDRSKFQHIVLYDHASTSSSRSAHLNMICDMITQTKKEKKEKAVKHAAASIQVLEGGIQEFQAAYANMVSAAPVHHFGDMDIKHGKEIPVHIQTNYDGGIRYTIVAKTKWTVVDLKKELKKQSNRKSMGSFEHEVQFFLNDVRMENHEPLLKFQLGPDAVIQANFNGIPNS